MRWLHKDAPAFSPNYSLMAAPSTILITGGSGFLAPNLAVAMAEAWPSADIYCLTEPGTTLPEVVADRRQIRTIEADLLSARLPDSTRLVVHCAAIRDPASPLLQQVNVEGTRLLADQAAAAGAGFIYASTQSVYGPANTMPASEMEMPIPDNEYGRAKLEGERMVAEAYDGALGNWVALRFARLYGAMHTSRYDGMLGRLLRAAKCGEIVTINGAGASIIDFLHIRDACSAILAVCDALPHLSGPYNISSGDPISILALAQLVRKHRPNLRWQLDPARSEWRGLWLDITRVTATLPWTPQVSIEEGIGEAVGAV